MRAVFGVEAERMGALRDAIGGLLTPGQTPALLLAALRRPVEARPTGAIGRALDRLDEVIYAEIARRRAQEDLGERTDILSLLMLARDDDGAAMTDQELRDELVTLLLAGHETTATSVAWAVERLVRHPDKLARLVAEIDAGEGDDYMQAVIAETLRVRPVVPMVVRVLQESLDVGGRELPRGTRVVPSIYLTNRNPTVYEAPSEFMPERFLDKAARDLSWIPFGGGIRRCIGASFATLEMKLILQTVLSELAPACRHAVGGCGARASGTAGAPSRSCPPPARGWFGPGAEGTNRLPRVPNEPASRRPGGVGCVALFRGDSRAYAREES